MLNKEQNSWSYSLVGNLCIKFVWCCSTYTFVKRRIMKPWLFSSLIYVSIRIHKEVFCKGIHLCKRNTKRQKCLEDFPTDAKMLLLVWKLQLSCSYTMYFNSMRWTSCVTNTTFINFWIFYAALDSYLFNLYFLINVLYPKFVANGQVFNYMCTIGLHGGLFLADFDHQ